MQMCEKDLEHFVSVELLAVSGNSWDCLVEKPFSLCELYLHVNLGNKLKQRHQEQEAERGNRAQKIKKADGTAC